MALVQELSRRAQAAQPLGDALDAYTESIACEVRAGRASKLAGELGLADAPDEASRTAFAGLLARLAQP